MTLLDMGITAAVSAVISAMFNSLMWHEMPTPVQTPAEEQPQPVPPEPYIMTREESNFCAKMSDYIEYDLKTRGLISGHDQFMILDLKLKIVPVDGGKHLYIDSFIPYAFKGDEIERLLDFYGNMGSGQLLSLYCSGL